MDMWLASRHSHGSVALNSQGEVWLLPSCARERHVVVLNAGGSNKLVPPLPLLAPRNDTAEFPYGRLAQPVLGQVADQDLLLDIGRQLQQIHNLTDARTRDVAQMS